MRKVFFIATAAVLLGFLAFAFAEEYKDVKTVMGKMQESTTAAGQGALTGKEQPMAMCPMHKMMMGAMMGKSVAVTEDGGVVVLAGEKLIKFDADLNFVKEVQIPIDTQAMQQKMSQMMKNCPMCCPMMQGQGM